MILRSFPTPTILWFCEAAGIMCQHIMPVATEWNASGVFKIPNVWHLSLSQTTTQQKMVVRISLATRKEWVLHYNTLFRTKIKSIVATILGYILTRSILNTFGYPALQPERCSQWYHLSHIHQMLLLGADFQNSYAKITWLWKITEDNHDNLFPGDLRWQSCVSL